MQGFSTRSEWSELMGRYYHTVDVNIKVRDLMDSRLSVLPILQDDEKQAIEFCRRLSLQGPYLRRPFSNSYEALSVFSPHIVPHMRRISLPSRL